jgi:hypothetical protein
VPGPVRDEVRHCPKGQSDTRTSSRHAAWCAGAGDGDPRGLGQASEAGVRGRRGDAGRRARRAAGGAAPPAARAETPEPNPRGGGSCARDKGAGNCPENKTPVKEPVTEKNVCRDI